MCAAPARWWPGEAAVAGRRRGAGLRCGATVARAVEDGGAGECGADTWRRWAERTRPAPADVVRRAEREDLGFRGKRTTRISEGAIYRHKWS